MKSLVNAKDNFGVLNQGYDICVLGSANTGKSSLILHYIYNRFLDQGNSQIEDLYTKVIRREGTYNEISILDSSSDHDSYLSSRKKQLLNNSGMVFTYAINDSSSFRDMEELFERVSELRLDMPPVVVAGLKSDLEDERNVSYEEGEHFAKSVNALAYIECSSLVGIKVEDVFKPLIDIIIQTKTYHRRFSHLKDPEITSMQSLKEVLSSDGSPTSSKQHSFKKIDFDSINITIPRYANSTSPGPKQTVASMSPVQSLGSETSPKNITVEAFPPQVPKDVTTVATNDVETKASKEQSGCCVIV